MCVYNIRQSYSYGSIWFFIYIALTEMVLKYSGMKKVSHICPEGLHIFFFN